MTPAFRQRLLQHIEKAFCCKAHRGRFPLGWWETREGVLADGRAAVQRARAGSGWRLP